MSSTFGVCPSLSCFETLGTIDQPNSQPYSIRIAALGPHQYTRPYESGREANKCTNLPRHAQHSPAEYTSNAATARAPKRGRRRSRKGCANGVDFLRCIRRAAISYFPRRIVRPTGTAAPGGRVERKRNAWGGRCDDVSLRPTSRMT